MCCQSFYQERLERDLGPFMPLLPTGATQHDPICVILTPSRPHRKVVARFD